MVHRNVLTVLVTVLLLSTPGGSIRAQGDVLFPGSTVPGDIARGEGVFFNGLGHFYLNSAQARSIDTDTAMRWNEYVYACQREANRIAYLRRIARKALIKDAFEKHQRSLRESPSVSDVVNGDALNVLLTDLSDPNIPSFVWQTARVALPNVSLRIIPFQSASGKDTLKGVLSMRRLKVHTWPLPLRDKALEPERTAYFDAIEALLDLNSQGQGKLTPDSIRTLQESIERLKAKSETIIDPSDMDYQRTAREFLDRLAKSAAMLRKDELFAADLLREIEDYPGTTIGDLVGLMRTFNVRFSPAEDPDERELYQNLRGLLAQQRELLARLGPQAQPPGGGPVINPDKDPPAPKPKP